MEPRILLVTDSETYYHLDVVRPDAPFSFVPYEGMLSEQAIAAFLNERRDQFDAVAVFGDDLYSGIRTAVLKHYDGPKILWHIINPNESEKVEGAFIAQIPPNARISEFDRIIREAFANL